MSQETVEVLVAFFAPLLVALFKQAGWPTWVNSVVAIIVYIVFGVGAVLMAGDTFDINNIIPAVTLFVTVGTVAYTAFWRNVGERSLVAKTSVVK